MKLKDLLITKGRTTEERLNDIERLLAGIETFQGVKGERGDRGPR